MPHDPNCRCVRAAGAARAAEALAEITPLGCGCGGVYGCVLCGQCLNHDHRTVQEQKAAKDLEKEPVASGVDANGKPFQIWGPPIVEPGLKRMLRVCPDGTKTLLNDWQPGAMPIKEPKSA